MLKSDYQQCPGTGTPEAGGWTSREVIRILRGLENCKALSELISSYLRLLFESRDVLQKSVIPFHSTDKSHYSSFYLEIGMLTLKFTSKCCGRGYCRGGACL